MAGGGNARKGRRLLTYVVVGLLLLIILAGVWSIFASSITGEIKITDVYVDWKGSSYTLLSLPYSSSPSAKGYGSEGLTFIAGFNESGSCTESCFDPDATFSVASATPGFQVSWVTTCYQSRGYKASLGGVYSKYSSAPPSVPFGCVSNGTTVDMSDVGLNSLVYLTVAVRFTTSRYSGGLALEATPTSNQTITPVDLDRTTTTLECAPGTVVISALTSCTVTVDDTTPSPTPPAGTVNFTATSGLFVADQPYCTLASSSTSSSTCLVNYQPAVLGVNDAIQADYAGDNSHQGSSGGYALEVFNYTLSISPTSESVSQGSTVTYTITARLTAGSPTTNLPNVSLAIIDCTPGPLSCTLSSTTVVPAQAGAAVTLTVATQKGFVQVPATFTLTVVGTTGSGVLESNVASNFATITLT